MYGTRHLKGELSRILNTDEDKLPPMLGFVPYKDVMVRLMYGPESRPTMGGLGYMVLQSSPIPKGWLEFCILGACFLEAAFLLNHPEPFVCSASSRSLGHF